MKAYRDPHHQVVIYLSSNDLVSFKEENVVSGELVDNTNNKKSKLEIVLCQDEGTDVNKRLVEVEDSLKVYLNRNVSKDLTVHKRFAYNSVQGRRFVHVYEIDKLKGENKTAYGLRFLDNES
jgi:hypothetical protein